MSNVLLPWIASPLTKAIIQINHSRYKQSKVNCHRIPVRFGSVFTPVWAVIFVIQ